MALTSALGPFGFDLETALMDEVECLDGVATIEDTRNVDLVCALADHLDVDVPLRERREHAPGDADHVPHLPAHHREDHHVMVHGHLRARPNVLHQRTRERERGGEGKNEEEGTHDADFLQVAYEARVELSIEDVLDRHADEDLARADEVHDDAEAVEGAEYAREEAVRDALPVRLHVQHDDALLDRHGRRDPLARDHPHHHPAVVAHHRPVAEDPVDKGGAKIGHRHHV